MNTAVQIGTGIVLLFVFTACIKASTEAANPKARLYLACTGWGAGVAVFWLVGISCYLAKPLSIYFVLPTLATILALVFLRRTLRSQAKTKGGG